jgi:ribonuclease HI
VLVNSDAAIFEAAGGMSAGVIMRDHQGTCFLACRQYFEGLLSPEHAEALAFRHAIQLARHEGRDRVIFASDCLSLVQRLNSSGLDRSSVGLVVSDIKQMATDFYEVSFRHVKRVLNEAAHLLAKSCNNVNSSCVFYSVPKLIRGTLCIDVA